ncbi:MAG: molybdopterin-dependent oxidoreductase [Candidatus Thermoplasmatota archaeon]|jgi:hypothetical protein|nr:molybdopterin-dependent oxidoreductase [Candidatus Thermoplasmatota archaeon]
MNGERDKADIYTKYIAILLAMIFIIAGCIYIYVNLPRGEEKHEEPTPTEEILLTIVFGSKYFNYSLDDLMDFEVVTGRGGYKRQDGTIIGPNNYTGVSLLEILDSIDSMPENYTIEAFAKDDRYFDYSIDEINGHVMIYNESGNETGIGNLTMIISYKENNVLLNESLGGPLKIVFVDEVGSITDSSLWAKWLVKIEIIT